MYGQSGYVGASMSVNAMLAYEDGEKPKSKWTKAAMLYEIGEVLFDLDFSDEDTERIMAAIGKMKKDEIFDRFLVWSSWHHTGKFANCTDFYEIHDMRVVWFAEEMGIEVDC
jgi:hypothetical protein